MPNPPAPAGPEALGYAAALQELDEILVELESGDVDVDRLADQVARAADLIAVCRERIDRARVTIEQVVVELDANDGADESPADDA